MLDLMNVSPSAAPDELRTLAAEAGRQRGYTSYSMKKYMLGVSYLLDWLITFNGVNWQERWEQAELQVFGGPQTEHAKSKFRHEAMRLALPSLLCLRLIRPSYRWLDAFKVSGMARALAATTDAEDFDLLTRAATERAYAGWRTLDSRNCLALLLMHTGKRLHTLTTADLLAFDQARQEGMFSNIGLMSLYQLLVDLEIVQNTPLSYSWNLHLKQVAIQDMLIVEGVKDPEILALFEAYLTERQLTLSPGSLVRECHYLIRRFWNQIPELERNESAFNLSFQTIQSIKATLRINVKTGKSANSKAIFHMISMLYAFINRKALEEPERWGRFAAKCPISGSDIRHARLKEEAKLEETQQCILSLLPSVNEIRLALKENYLYAQKLLECAICSQPGEVFHLEGTAYLKIQLPQNKNRRELQPDVRDVLRRVSSNERGSFKAREFEEQAFWIWISVEILLRTGLRAIELYKLKRTDITYRTNKAGARIPCLKIAASKTILPRIIDLSPEAFSLIYQVIQRVQGDRDTYPLADRYDKAAKTFEFSQPFLLQLEILTHRKGFKQSEIPVWLKSFFLRMHSKGRLSKKVYLRLQDCRRIFATRLHQREVPILAISRTLGHKNVRTTMRYVAYQGEDMHVHLDNLWEKI